MFNAQILDPIPLWALYTITVLLGLLAAEIGYRLGQARHRRLPDEQEGAVGALSGGALAMLAFLLAFIIGFADTRYDARRQLVVEDANAIRTAYLRAGYVDEPERTKIRDLLREYLDLRLAVLDPAKTQQALARSDQIQAELWSQAEAIARVSTTDVGALAVESVNEVISMQAARIAAARARIPDSIWLAVYVVSFLALMLVGYHESYSGHRNLVALVVLVLAFSAVILLIADLDRSQQGLLTVSQQPLIDLQQQLKGLFP